MNRCRTLAALAAAAALLADLGAAAGKPRSIEPVGTQWRHSAALERGVNMWANGEKEKALEAFKEATRVSPRDPLAWHNIGIALMSASKFGDALDAFRHERFLTPTAPSAHYGMGLCLLALGRPAEAENAFVMAVVERPGTWIYWRALSRAFAAQGKEEQAEIAACNAARLRPRMIPRYLGFKTIRRIILSPPTPAVPTPRISWAAIH